VQKKLVKNHKIYLSSILQYIYLVHQNPQNSKIIKGVMHKYNKSSYNCIKNINLLEKKVYQLLKTKPFLVFDICVIMLHKFKGNTVGLFKKYYSDIQFLFDFFKSI
jgi:hypothetical protein